MIYINIKTEQRTDTFIDVETTILDTDPRMKHFYKDEYIQGEA